MPRLVAVLNDEIRRLARKEIRTQVGATKRAVGQYRREIAALKRQIQRQARTIAFLEAEERKRLSGGTVTRKSTHPHGRFSSKWLTSHRQRLGVSAEEYGKLVGVSGKTIYNWEQGKSKPAQRQLAGVVAVRGLGKRAVLKRIEMVTKRTRAAKATHRSRRTARSR